MKTRGDRRLKGVLYEVEEERRTERKNNEGIEETEESPLPSVNFPPPSLFFALSSPQLFFLSYFFQLYSS